VHSFLLQGIDRLALSPLVYRWLATVLKVVLTFEPIAVSALTMTMAISAQVNPYSIAVAPSSFLKRLLNPSNIGSSSRLVARPILVTEDFKNR
jgi:hypothetical protein